VCACEDQTRPEPANQWQDQEKNETEPVLS
jgi:hypothetical protein